ncbi:MAG: hypothetical protein AAFZ07_11530 [Actinomycetota bacterium]
MSVVTVLLVLANVLGVGMIVPQAIRLARVRSLAGVSVPWIGISLALNAWWIGYGVAQARWGVVPVSIGGFLLYLWMARLAVGIGGPVLVRGLLGGVAAASVGPAVGLVTGGWLVAGLIIGLSYGVQFAPAAWSAVRSERLDGISPATWVMAWAEAAIWFVYGLDAGDAALLVGGGGGTVMASIILVRLLDRRGGDEPVSRLARLSS